MFEIPIPPAPQIPALWGWVGAGGALVVGTVMLLWGRHVHRALLVLVGAGAGVAMAGPLSRWLDVNIVLLRIVPAVVLAIVGLLAARLVWALLAGAVVALATGSAILLAALHRAGEAVSEAPPTETLADWPVQTALNLLDALSQSGNLPLALAASFIVGGAATVILLLRPVAARILMTSLLAAVVLMGSMLLASVQVRESFWQTTWEHAYVPAAGAAALMLLGWVWQFCCAGRERRKEQEAEKRKQKEKDDAEQAKSRKA